MSSNLNATPPVLFIFRNLTSICIPNKLQYLVRVTLLIPVTSESSKTELTFLAFSLILSTISWFSRIALFLFICGLFTKTSVNYVGCDGVEPPELSQQIYSLPRYHLRNNIPFPSIFDFLEGAEDAGKVRFELT